MPNKTARDFFGWFGVVAILLAYGLNVFAVISSRGYIFLLLNLIGSAGIVAVAWPRRDFQPLALNIIWLIVAVIGVLRLLT